MQPWYVMADGQRLGPISTEDLLSWARAGRLKPIDLVWREGMPQWLPANQVEELTAAVPALAVAAAPALGDDPAMRLLLPVGRSGWAIAAGYLGLVSVLLVPAPFALLCGWMAVRDIRRNPKKHGMGRAVFGIVMGALGLALLIVVIVTSSK